MKLNNFNLYFIILSLLSFMGRFAVEAEPDEFQQHGSVVESCLYPLLVVFFLVSFSLDVVRFVRFSISIYQRFCKVLLLWYFSLAVLSSLLVIYIFVIVYSCLLLDTKLTVHLIYFCYSSIWMLYFVLVVRALRWLVLTSKKIIAPDKTFLEEQIGVNNHQPCVHKLKQGKGYSSDNSGDGPERFNSTKKWSRKSVVKFILNLLATETLTEVACTMRALATVAGTNNRDKLKAIYCFMIDSYNWGLISDSEMIEFDEDEWIIDQYSITRLKDDIEFPFTLAQAPRSFVNFVDLMNRLEPCVRVTYKQDFMVGMINNRVINQGARRRGGNQRGPFPPGDRRHVPNALQIAQRLNFYGPAAPVPPIPNGEQPPTPVSQWYVDNKLKIEASFIFSDFPKVKCLFDFEELDNYNEDNVLLDPMGSPFCGYTAIDIATNRKPNINNYLDKVKYKENPFFLGTSSELRKYAFHRGINLRVLVPYQNDDTDFFDYMNDVRWKWLILVIKDQNGGILRDGGLNANEVNHVFIVLDEKSNYTNLEIPLFEPEPIPWGEILLNYLTSKLFTMTIVLLIKYVIPGLIDLIQIVFGYVPYIGWFLKWFFGFDGEPLCKYVNNGDYFPKCFYLFEYFLGDKYYYPEIIIPWLDECLYIYFNFYKIIKCEFVYTFVDYLYNNSDLDHRNARERLDGILHQDHYAKFKKEFYLTLFNRKIFSLQFFGWDKTVLVSVVRANQLIKEVQLLSNEEALVALTSLAKTSTINSVDSCGKLYYDTMLYVKFYHSKLEDMKTTIPKTMVAYAAQGSASYMNNLQIIGINQILYTCGYSYMTNEENGEEFGSNLMFNFQNYFSVFNKKNLKEVERTEISFAPLGVLRTDKGDVGPGNVCKTEPYSLLAAICGRSMSKYPCWCPEFYNFAKKEIDRLLRTVDSSGVIIDEDPINCFREINKGKRSLKYIQRRVEDYEMIEIKKLKRNKKFYQNSCFVKMEDSTKLKNGVPRVRPRLIMTMSDYYSVKLSPLKFVIDQWNHSLIEKYQIKGADPKMFIDRIFDITNKQHIVTDYSAFEASVSMMFKMVENKLLIALCDKFQLYETKRNYQRLFDFKRELHCPIGTFVISSRCSGDYTTSMCNCLINYLINAYSMHKLGLNIEKMQLIVEGDDGLTLPCQMDSKIINNLGFEFSDNTLGTKPGDVDFLRKRWLETSCIVNLGRSLKNLLWVNSTQKLTIKKQLAILRAKALSYHHMSPGHPVLHGLIKYILSKTAGLNYFKGMEKYVDSFNSKGFDIRNIGRNYHIGDVNESLRSYIASGAIGFHPIPVASQLILEKNLEKGVFYLSSIFNEYDDLNNAVINKYWNNKDMQPKSEEIKWVERLFDFTDYFEYCDYIGDEPYSVPVPIKHKVIR